ncbi:MAG TPA: DUF4157 domain-containing protein [Pyrinomonadaceae bacterium]
MRMPDSSAPRTDAASVHDEEAFTVGALPDSSHIQRSAIEGQTSESHSPESALNISRSLTGNSVSFGAPVSAAASTRISAKVPSPAHSVLQRQSDEQAEEQPELEASPLQMSVAAAGGLVEPPDDEDTKPNRTLSQKSTFTNSRTPVTHSTAQGIEESLQRSRGGGLALPPRTRAFMEERFAMDLSGVRVHTSAESNQLNRRLHAYAFTIGHDIHFAEGMYRPGTPAGDRLLAHELTHVVQQSGGGGLLHARRMMQRQPDPAVEKEEEHEKDFGIPGPPQPAPAELPGFGDVAPDAACPKLPTNLGSLAPEPPCPTADSDITGEGFTFCRASDVFSPGTERPRLITWARSQPATSTFVVHGYASESDGTPAQNVNVSCHRAKRVARELYNAGVRSERIEIAARGGTTRFGTGAAKLALNRVAIVRAQAPAARAGPATLPTDRRALIDLGVGKLTRGEYNLAADAYLSRWTCGRIPSLAEAVRRSVVRVEGEKLTAEFHPDDAVVRKGDARLGFPIRVGRNEIVLARETFDDTTDPLSCVMARIADMVFHHTVSDLIPNFSQQHSAALFLVELAGLPPCHSPDAQVFQGAVGRPQFDWWRRPTTDPRKAIQPDCGAFAEGPLPGAITPQPVPPTSPAAPTFTVLRFLFDGSGGAATAFVYPQADVDPAKNIAASGRIPGSGTSIRAVASVVASGSPAEVAGYQVGFVQTIVSDRVVVDYVGGQRVRFELPVPIRDGPRRENAAPPWFDPGLVDTVTEPGRPAIAGLLAEPWMYFPYHFMDPALRGRMKKDPKDPKKKKEVPEEEVEIGNIVNRAHRATLFHTWLVARRDDAPLDRFSTHVLDGRLVAWTQRADFIGAAGTGSFEASVDPTPLTDTTDMQLGGPTAAELDPPWVDGRPSPSDLMRSRRVVEVAEAPPKPPLKTPTTLTGGLSEIDYIHRIQEIAKEIEPLRRVLRLSEKVTLRIRIDPETGRPQIHRPPESPAVTADYTDPSPVKPDKNRKPGEPEGDPDLFSRPALARYAEEILFRARKDLVLAETKRVADSGLPVLIPAIELSERPKDVMSPDRRLSATELIEERRLDVESQQRRLASPGEFDPEFRVPVTVKFAIEEYLFDFSLSFDEVQVACKNKGGPKSASCLVPQFVDRNNLTVDVEVALERLGVGFVHSPVEVAVTLTPLVHRLFVPRDGIKFEGMSGRGVTEDSLNHELHHLIDDHNLTQVFKERLARAIRGRLMALRHLAASDRSMRAGALTKGAVEAVVHDEYIRYMLDFDREGERLADLLHEHEDHPLLTEAEIQRLWPEFRMPARRPGSKGSLTR